jgi:hypothetical protein
LELSGDLGSLEEGEAQSGLLLVSGPRFGVSRSCPDLKVNEKQTRGKMAL